MEDNTATRDERRAPAPSFTLIDGLAVDVVVPLAGDHIVFSGHVVHLTDTTVAVAMDDGPTALTVAMCRRCVLVWGPEGEERCAMVRNGRRVEDVRSPTTIELVLEEVTALADLGRDDPEPHAS